MSFAWAAIGVITFARYETAFGKCFSISRFTLWQQLDMIMLFSRFSIIFSYSRFTTVAPIAVGSASAKPSAMSAFLTSAKLLPPNIAA